MPQMISNVVLTTWLMIGGAGDRPTPPHAPGFVSVELCLQSKSSQDLYAGFALINPNAINGISNPPVSPKGCIRMYVAGRTLYAIGTEAIMAEKIAKALRERAEFNRE